MTDQHPITPPPELVEQWRTAPEYASDREMLMMVSMTTRRLQEIADQAAQWGSDQELEACCEWVRATHFIDLDGHEALRAARRPKPPSLAEEALATLDSMQIEPVVINGVDVNADVRGKYSTIRRALKRLQELEGQG